MSGNKSVVVGQGCENEKIRKATIRLLDRDFIFGILDRTSTTDSELEEATQAEHVPSVEHHKLLAHFLFNCYQISYVVYSTFYLRLHVQTLFFGCIVECRLGNLFRRSSRWCHACPARFQRDTSDWSD